MTTEQPSHATPTKPRRWTWIVGIAALIAGVAIAATLIVENQHAAKAEADLVPGAVYTFEIPAPEWPVMCVLRRGQEAV